MRRPPTLGILLDRAMESALLKQVEKAGGLATIRRSSKSASRRLALKIAAKFMSEERELTKAWTLCKLEALIEEERMQMEARTQQGDYTGSAAKSAKTKKESS